MQLHVIHVMHAIHELVSYTIDWNKTNSRKQNPHSWLSINHWAILMCIDCVFDFIQIGLEIVQCSALAEWTMDEPNIDLSDPVASSVICIALHIFNVYMRIICPRNVFSKILIFLLCLSFSISENTSRIINLKRSPLFAFNTHLVITVSVNVYMYLGTRIYDFRMYENYNICTTDWVLGLLASLLLTFYLYRLMQSQLWYELK